MPNKPRTLSELYPSKWLSPADLERPVTAAITEIAVEDLRQSDGSTEPKLVISFRNASKRWVCNVTQGKRLAELLGTEVFDQWIGARVRLGSGKATNGKPTIVVIAATKLPANGWQQGEQPAAPEPDKADNSTASNGGQAAGMSDQEAKALWDKSPAEGGTK